MNTPKHILQTLRCKAKSSESVADMVRWLLTETSPRSRLDVVEMLKDAFYISLSDASPIMGWEPDGSGELSDAQVEAFIQPRILIQQHCWDDERSARGS